MMKRQVKNTEYLFFFWLLIIIKINVNLIFFFFGAYNFIVMKIVVQKKLKRCSFVRQIV